MLIRIGANGLSPTSGQPHWRLALVVEEVRMVAGRVICVAIDGAHRFSKCPVDEIELIAGLGVRGDAHQGQTVQHRSRVAVDPSQPNLRQVHLVHSELLEELADKGFAVSPAAVGENVTTQGLDLLAVPAGTLLRVGRTGVLEVTGLRNPCAQIERFQTGLLAVVLDRGAAGELIRKAGVMAIVRESGIVRRGDRIAVKFPALPHRPLQPV